MMRPLSSAVINTIRVRPLVIEQREERRAVEPPILELEPARHQGSLADEAGGGGGRCGALSQSES